MKQKIKRIYVPYWEWEDFNSGMWRKLHKDDESEYLKKAIKFTGNHVRYGKAMSEVIKKWPRTMLNTMTNASVNKRAFLGHCACQYKIQCPEYIVRTAWGMLSGDQRSKADTIAEHHINQYLINHEKRNRRLYNDMGIQMLFEWPS